VPVGRDAGAVLAHADVPHDAAVGNAQRERLLLERREEDERPDDERRPEDPAADVPCPELATRRRVVGARHAVEVAEEDAAVRDRRRRVARRAQVVCPERLPIRRAQGDDEPGARDREEA